tara:strand:- start:459 stop:623 length:165 start_codon:yes stop_codon:yes gene_type:complete
MLRLKRFDIYLHQHLLLLKYLMNLMNLKFHQHLKYLMSQNYQMCLMNLSYLRFR